MAKYPGVSPSVTRRLPRYHRHLEELMKNGVERISSREFSEITGLTASQIRQDLNCFGGFGQQGYGYSVAALYTEIGRILQLNAALPTVLIGAGNLGSALVQHINFKASGFDLLAVFDNSPQRIGQTIGSWVIQDIVGFTEFCQKRHPAAAVLCIPKEAAAELAKPLIDNGIRGIWNFSHYNFSILYGDKLAVENVHLSDSLMTLSFYINELPEANSTQ